MRRERRGGRALGRIEREARLDEIAQRDGDGDWKARVGGEHQDISKLYRAGARQSWFEIFPGANDITLSATSGTGSVTISYRKAFY